MKTIIITVFLLIFTVTAANARGLLQTDANGRPFEGPAPDGSKISLLTVNKVTIDMTNDVWWGLYTPTACKYRVMDSTAVAGHNQQTAPVNALTSRYVNANFPFINFSGCTNGELQRQ